MTLADHIRQGKPKMRIVQLVEKLGWNITDDALLCVPEPIMTLNEAITLISAWEPLRNDRKPFRAALFAFATVWKIVQGSL
jgi:hypothetical protein